jgi:hypothetical protein
VAVAVGVAPVHAHAVAGVGDAQRRGDLREPATAEVVVQDARFGALGVGVAVEGIPQAHVVATRADRVGGVDAHVGHEQIEQAVAVVVEEHGAGGVAHVADARLCGDVPELAAAEILEETVAVAHRRHEQVGQPVVIDVGEGARNRDGVRHAHTRRIGDVGEPAPAQILPQLARAELGDEEQIG